MARKGKKSRRQAKKDRAKQIVSGAVVLDPKNGAVAKKKTQTVAAPVLGLPTDGGQVGQDQVADVALAATIDPKISVSQEALAGMEKFTPEARANMSKGLNPDGTRKEGTIPAASVLLTPEGQAQAAAGNFPDGTPKPNVDPLVVGLGADPAGMSDADKTELLARNGYFPDGTPMTVGITAVKDMEASADSVFGKSQAPTANSVFGKPQAPTSQEELDAAGPAVLGASSSNSSSNSSSSSSTSPQTSTGRGRNTVIGGDPRNATHNGPTSALDVVDAAVGDNISQEAVDQAKNAKVGSIKKQGAFNPWMAPETPMNINKSSVADVVFGDNGASQRMYSRGKNYADRKKAHQDRARYEEMYMAGEDGIKTKLKGLREEIGERAFMMFIPSLENFRDPATGEVDISVANEAIDKGYLSYRKVAEEFDKTNDKSKLLASFRNLQLAAKELHKLPAEATSMDVQKVLDDYMTGEDWNIIMQDPKGLAAVKELKKDYQGLDELLNRQSQNTRAHIAANASVKAAEALRAQDQYGKNVDRQNKARTALNNALSYGNLDGATGSYTTYMDNLQTIDNLKGSPNNSKYKAAKKFVEDYAKVVALATATAYQNYIDAGASKDVATAAVREYTQSSLLGTGMVQALKDYAPTTYSLIYGAPTPAPTPAPAPTAVPAPSPTPAPTPGASGNTQGTGSPVGWAKQLQALTSEIKGSGGDFKFATADKPALEGALKIAEANGYNELATKLKERIAKK